MIVKAIVVRFYVLQYQQICLYLSVIWKYEKYKGIHPGAVLERELKKRGLSQRYFALSLSEHPQTINAITKGNRDLNIPLALKIEKMLGLEEGTMALLQTFYDIEKQKKKECTPSRPDLSILRKILFWDTDINKIDWDKNSAYVINRVFERGNEQEKKEIFRFYSEDKIREVTGKSDPYSRIPVMQHLKAR
ncbi:helix-turn-helix transcriptional regulator [Pedobacter segetis]|uniref:helix-turn-helix transcriptional regulator n=1 Tax=Pedobacter segetis TaxID=2793069 RepID=UPI001F2D1247|nr:helix-turn-helix domain-containing protein [Pedobacter segetis]